MNAECSGACHLVWVYFLLDSDSRALHVLDCANLKVQLQRGTKKKLQAHFIHSEKHVDCLFSFLAVSRFPEDRIIFLAFA